MESKKCKNWDHKGCPDNPKVRILRFECIDQFEIKHVHAPPPSNPQKLLLVKMLASLVQDLYRSFSTYENGAKDLQPMQLPWVARLRFRFDQLNKVHLIHLTIVIILYTDFNFTYNYFLFRRRSCSLRDGRYMSRIKFLPSGILEVLINKLSYN